MAQALWPFSRARVVSAYDDSRPPSGFPGGPVRPCFPLVTDNQPDIILPDGGLSSGDGQQPGDTEEAPDGQEEFPVRARPGPAVPTKAEVDHHEVTGHTCYRT